MYTYMNRTDLSISPFYYVLYVCICGFSQGFGSGMSGRCITDQMEGWYGRCGTRDAIYIRLLACIVVISVYCPNSL